MSLHEFLALLRRRFWSIALIAILVTAAALAIVYQREPVYTSAARVEVRLAWSNGDSNSSNASLLAGMDSEAVRVKTESVVRIAAPDLGLDPGSETDVASVIDQIDVTVPSNTVFLDIACTQSTPEAAQACADTFAKAYVEDRESTAQAAYANAREGPQAQIASQTRRINALSADLAAATSPADQLSLQNRIGLITATRELAITQLALIPAPSPSPAAVALTAPYPTTPSNKDFVLTGVLALLLGLVLGLGMAFVRERLDERIGGRAGLEGTIDGPVLAVIPRVKGWRSREEVRLVSLSEPDGMAAESYRGARAAILYRAGTSDIQVIEITSPGEREGKTTTTANLAVSLAQTGKTVVAISCDLRRPRLHRFFGLDNSVGLSNLLAGEVDPGTIRETEVKGLRVITSGPVPANPAELLESDAMDELIRWLRGKADFLLLDTAPALIVADALALAPRCDGAVIVADARNTTRGALARVRHELNSVGVPIIGAILNRLDRAQAKRYPDQYDGYYSSSYRYRAEESNGSRDGSPRKTSERNPEQESERQPPQEPAREMSPEVVEVDEAEQLDPRERMWHS